MSMRTSIHFSEGVALAEHSILVGLLLLPFCFFFTFDLRSYCALCACDDQFAFSFRNYPPRHTLAPGQHMRTELFSM